MLRKVPLIVPAYIACLSAKPLFVEPVQDLLLLLQTQWLCIRHFLQSAIRCS